MSCNRVVKGRSEPEKMKDKTAERRVVKPAAVLPQLSRCQRPPSCSSLFRFRPFSQDIAEDQSFRIYLIFVSQSWVGQSIVLSHWDFAFLSNHIPKSRSFFTFSRLRSWSEPKPVEFATPACHGCAKIVGTPDGKTNKVKAQSVNQKCLIWKKVSKVCSFSEMNIRT